MNNALKPCQKGAAPTAPFGVLLVNLGSPDAPTPAAVKRYLSEFLSDHRVVDLRRWLWWPILHGIVLQLRPRKVAKLYQSIWRNDAPLREIGLKQAEALQAQLQREAHAPIPVVLGMTYGNPSLRDALGQLRRRGVERVLVLPLYPQYSCSTSGSVFDRVTRAFSRCRQVPPLRFVQHYFDHPGYISALANHVKAHWQQHGRSEKLLIAFHGLPQRYVDEGDPYSRHCEITAHSLANALDLNDADWEMMYQSRFGREPWLQPYADETLAKLAQQGVKSVDVICPGFAADCLETLEEIQVRSAEQFVHQGGQSLRYIPALNDQPDHIALLAELVKKETHNWI